MKQMKGIRKIRKHVTTLIMVAMIFGNSTTAMAATSVETLESALTTNNADEFGNGLLMVLTEYEGILTDEEIQQINTLVEQLKHATPSDLQPSIQSILVMLKEERFQISETDGEELVESVHTVETEEEAQAQVVDAQVQESAEEESLNAEMADSQNPNIENEAEQSLEGVQTESESQPETQPEASTEAETVANVIQVGEAKEENTPAEEIVETTGVIEEVAEETAESETQVITIATASNAVGPGVPQIPQEEEKIQEEVPEEPQILEKYAGVNEYLLAQMGYCEAGAAGADEMMKAMRVALNRMNNTTIFGRVNTLEAVLAQRGQYPTTWRKIRRGIVPSPEALDAAHRVLCGEPLYYYDENGVLQEMDDSILYQTGVPLRGTQLVFKSNLHYFARA